MKGSTEGAEAEDGMNCIRLESVGCGLCVENHDARRVKQDYEKPDGWK